MRDGYLNTSDLARAVGVSTQHVRDYENWGVLPRVERHANGYRCYTRQHLEALRTVRKLRAAGYGRQEMRRIMQAVHTNDLDDALTLIDARHAVFDRQRRQLAHVLEAIRSFATGPGVDSVGPQPGNLLIGAAASAVSVRPSALRFWEQEGLIQPGRDRSNGYRTFDQEQMRRLQIVALLRAINCGLDEMHAVLDEFPKLTVDAHLAGAESRLRVIAASSQACSEATAAVWNYASRFPCETSGT